MSRFKSLLIALAVGVIALFTTASIEYLAVSRAASAASTSHR